MKLAFNNRDSPAALVQVLTSCEARTVWRVVEGVEEIYADIDEEGEDLKKLRPRRHHELMFS